VCYISYIIIIFENKGEILVKMWKAKKKIVRKRESEKVKG